MRKVLRQRTDRVLESSEPAVSGKASGSEKQAMCSSWVLKGW